MSAAASPSSRLGAPLQVRRDVPPGSDPGGNPRHQQSSDRPRPDRRDAARTRDHVDDVLELEPVTQAPETDKIVEGLMREDLFMVSAEHFISITASYADILLPATMGAEMEDMILSWGHSLSPTTPNARKRPARLFRTTRSSVGSPRGSASKKKTSSGATRSAWNTTSIGTHRPAKATTWPICASTVSRA